MSGYGSHQGLDSHHCGPSTVFTQGELVCVFHPALTHLKTLDLYVRLLYLDFSSMFNSIILQTLISTLLFLGLKLFKCN